MAYAECILAGLPRRLQEARQAAGLISYALWQECGVSQDTLCRIEAGASVPTCTSRRASPTAWG